MNYINVDNYVRHVQKYNYGFGRYRKAGEKPHRVGPDHYRSFEVPASRRPPMFDGIQQDLHLEHYYETAPSISDLHNRSLGSDEENYEYQIQLRDYQDYFNSTKSAGWWRAKRVLGIGGNGMAIHYGYCPTPEAPGQDVVVKVNFRGHDADSWWEKRAMKRQRRSAHCVQMFDPEDFDMPRPPDTIRDVPLDDSSDDQITDTEGPVGPITRSKRPRPRSERPANWWTSRQARHRRRYEVRRHQIEKSPQHSKRDYFLLEFVENGSLASLIEKLVRCRGGNDPVHIPSRVLWAFWLCMVRACIGLEYPPIQFHPQIPERAFEVRRGMRRSFLGLGLKAPVHKFPQQGDLIETIPDDNALKSQGRNIVHFDIDPNNILISGFELDDEAHTKWQDSWKSGKGFAKSLDNTQRQPDRHNGEHLLVPRLKLADFGLAERVKLYKRNIYYQSRRIRGKQGMFAPEQFTGEWDLIPPEPNGDQLGLQEVAGNYSRKTNIWGMAWVGVDRNSITTANLLPSFTANETKTMWILITQRYPPEPPQAQLPREYDCISIPNGQTRRELETLLADATSMDKETYPITYCPLLDEDEYEHVDNDLRETIRTCMYHKPSDRPDLNILLEEALEKNEEDFGETDDEIREWIRDLLYDAASSLPSFPKPPLYRRESGGDKGNTSPSSGGVREGEGGGDNRGRNGGGSDPRTNATQQVLYQLQRDIRYPYGLSRIFNNAENLQCGLQALYDSLRAQVPTIANDTTLPDRQRLSNIYDQLVIAGEIVQASAWIVDAEDHEQSVSGNFRAEHLARVLSEWGHNNNIELELMVEIQGAYILPLSGDMPPGADSVQIWIYNDNVRARSGDPNVYNHYEGMRPVLPPSRPPPADVDSLNTNTDCKVNRWLPDAEGDNDSLPDYESP